MRSSALLIRGERATRGGRGKLAAVLPKVPGFKLLVGVALAAMLAAPASLAASLSCERVISVVTDADVTPLTIPVSGLVCDPSKVSPQAVGVATATGTGIATVTISDASRSWGIGTARARNVGDYPQPPPGVVFPHGLVELIVDGCANGATSHLSIDFPATLPAGYVFYRFGATPDNAAPHWYTFNTAGAGARVDFDIRDGGYGDDDLVADGRVMIVGGPALNDGAQPSQIPLMGPPLVLLLISLVALTAWLMRAKLFASTGAARIVLLIMIAALAGAIGDTVVMAIAQTRSVAPVALAPPNIAFGAALPGNVSASVVVTATNTSAVPLRILEVVAPDNFQQDNDCSILPANAQCRINVRFAPAAFGGCAALPPPLLTAITPPSIPVAPATAPPTAIDLTGTGFLPGATVRFDALRQGTLALTPQTIRVNVPSDVRAVAATVSVSVVNPDGQASNSLPLQVDPGTLPPTVSITSPVDGSSYVSPASVPLAATAAAPGSTVDRVEFFANGGLIATTRVAPYQYGWNGIGAGTYTLTAKVTNAAGATATSASVNVSVRPPANQPPVVTLTSPQSGQSFTAGTTIALAADASDVDGTIKRVEFYEGTTLLGSATIAPYGVPFVGAAVGSHTLTAKAYDNLDASAVSPPVTISVGPHSNEPPVASITSPLPGQSFMLGTQISVAASASDPDGSVTKVEFYDGANLIATVTTPPYSVAWSGSALGAHTLTARATDNLGATGTSTPVAISVIASTGPVVTLLSPADHAVFGAPATIPVAASASSDGATITKVEFFANATSIGSTGAAPYGILWSAVPVGEYVLTATATDSLSRQATSAPISVSVQSLGDEPEIIITSHADNQVVDTDSIALAGITRNVASVSVPGFCDPVQFASAAFSAAPIPLTFGDNQIIVNGVGTHGQAVSTSVTLKNKRPSLTISAPADNVTVESNSLQIEGSFLAQQGSSVALTRTVGLQGTLGTLIMGSSFSGPMPLRMGANVIIATLSTPDGYTVTRTVHVTRVAPTGLAIKITNPADQQLIEATQALVEGTVTAPTGSTVSVNGVFATVAANRFSATIPVAPGLTHLPATVRRADGATAQDAIWLLNAYPRAGPISMPVDGSIVATSTVMVEGVAVGPDGSSITVNTLPVTIVEKRTYAAFNLQVSSNIYHFQTEVPIVAGDNALELSVTTPHGSHVSKVVHVTGDAAASAPVVAITDPTGTTQIREFGNVNIAAQASSPRSRLVRVELFEDGTLVPGNDIDAIATSAFWSVYTVPAGTHTFRVKATDRTGSFAFSQPLTVIAKAAPTVSLISPANNAQFTVGQTIKVTANAASATGTVARVDFIDHGTTILRTLTAPPFSFDWTTAALGSHALTAKATDDSGYSTISAPIAITVASVPNTPPTVALTSPHEGDVFAVGSNIALAATAADADGSVASVAFYAGATLLGTSTTAPYTLAWNNVAAGSYVLTAVATDNRGAQTTSAAVHVSAADVPPLTISTPAANASIAADFVLVTGTYQAPLNSGVVVNGVVARNDLRGHYFVNNLPIVPGANTLTVTLTRPDGTTEIQTRTVTSTASAPMQVYAEPDADFAGATYTIRLTDRTDNPIVHVSYPNLGGGILDTSAVDQTTLGKITYASPGIYSPGFVITDSVGNVYSQTVALLVQDKTALDTMLKSMIRSFTTALAAGNKAGALQLMTLPGQAQYGPIFDQLLSHMADIVAQWSAPQTGLLRPTIADYGINRTIDGVNRIFLINVMRDSDGVWRLDSM